MPKFKDILSLLETLQYDLLKSADFNMKTVFEIAALKYSNNVFWVQNLRNFCFYTKIRVSTKLRVLILNMIIVSSNFNHKLTKKEILGARFKYLYFYTKHCILTNSRRLISNITIVFQNYDPKIPN